MREMLDLVVLGAGPAGLAAAATASETGLSVLLVDEQAEPGGQIYRAVETVAALRPADLPVLGKDYAHGGSLVQAFRASRAAYLPGAALWQVAVEDDSVALGCTNAGGSEVLRARRLVVATGAMERPVPVPGWTLPGVMGAGAAQVLLKSAGMVPAGRVVLAGSGPLLLLVAAQLVAAGAEVAAVLETTTWRDYLRAAPRLPAALAGPGYLREGLRLRRRIRRAGVPMHMGIRGLRASGDGRVRQVAWDGGESAADTLLLHEGVVPNVQVTRQLECAHAWDPVQRYWRPVLDEWGGTSLPGVAVAGDSGGIAGARAAELSGRLASLSAAHLLGRLTAAERDRRAQPLRRELRRHRAIRPLLDRLFPPSPDILTPADETIVCRCEEVTAGAVRETVRLGCLGPNQVKAFTRSGMGPCQGRMCGLAVAEIIAAARGVPVPEVGYYRVRPPIKPLTLGELAALEAADA